MILRELGQILIHIENDRDRDDENDGKEVSANKLLDDIPVEPLDIAEGVDPLQPTELSAKPGYCQEQKMKMTAQPPASLSQPARMPSYPSCRFQSFAMFPDFAEFHVLCLVIFFYQDYR